MVHVIDLAISCDLCKVADLQSSIVIVKNSSFKLAMPLMLNFLSCFDC